MDGLTNAWEPTLEELSAYYREHLTLGCLATDIGSKFALISLICFLTKQARKNKPDATCAQVIKKIVGDSSSNSKGLLKAVAVICEDYMRNTTEFLTFNLKSSKEMVDKIKEILHCELPFENPYNCDDDLPF